MASVRAMRGLNSGLKRRIQEALTVPAKSAERSGKASLLLGIDAPSILNGGRARNVTPEPVLRWKRSLLWNCVEKSQDQSAVVR